MSYNIINEKGDSNCQNVEPDQFSCKSESVIQEMFKTTSENTEELQHLTESCKYNREKVEEIIKHLETETARVSKRYDETMDAVDMYFEEVTDTLDILNTMQRLNDEQLEDIDKEIAKARKMQLRTHVVCAIAMISSIASIVLTIILE